MAADTVQILLATYNGEKYLKHQLESILKQDYEQWGLLIADDCSSDNTLSIIEEFVAKDKRISTLPMLNNNIGSSETFFRLLRCADADYVMFCDQDDVWMPCKIRSSMSKMREMEVRYGSSAPINV